MGGFCDNPRSAGSGDALPLGRGVDAEGGEDAGLERARTCDDLPIVRRAGR